MPELTLSPGSTNSATGGTKAGRRNREHISCWRHRAVGVIYLFGLHVYSSCTHWLRPRRLISETPQPPLPRIWAHIRGRYWSAMIDDIFLWPPGGRGAGAEFFACQQTYKGNGKSCCCQTHPCQIIGNYRAHSLIQKNRPNLNKICMFFEFWSLSLKTFWQ